MRLAVICFASCVLTGCAVVDVATTPVRIAGRAVDLATTSQSEADERRGRELRQREERYGKLIRDHRQAQARCSNGIKESCIRAAAIANEMAELRRQLPNGYTAEPE